MNLFLYSRDVNKEGIKPRYIIEVTRDNIDYCKELIKILDLRHLDNLRGNFVLYENKYIFLYDDYNVSANNKGDREENKEDNSTGRLVGTEFRTEIVKQQQRLFDTLWDNSIPANVRVNEIENCEKGSSHAKDIRLNNNFHEQVESQSNTSDGDSKNTVIVIRNKQDIEYLLLSNVYNARSEVLLTVSSLEYLKNLWKIGLKESLEHANSQGARIIILYPEFRNKEIIDNDVLSLISSIENNVHLESIAGTTGSVLIVDNSKILLLDRVGGGVGGEDENTSKDRNIDIIGVYSNNKSIVNNYGALFDTPFE